MKVLIIEDSKEIAESMSLCFQIRWPQVKLSFAAEGVRGIETAKSETFDLIVLDLNLPDIDGFKVLEQIRSFSKMPIVIVTVRGNEQDQALGLEMGADDYIVKPFRPRDLIARVNAILRRTQGTKPTPKEYPFIGRGRLTLNLATDEVLLGEQIIKLTPTESRLLYALMNNVEHTMSIKKLLEEAWGRENVGNGTVRTYIRRLRDKLKDRPSRIILNQRGGGYRFVSPIIESYLPSLPDVGGRPV